jgi:hypothetical protein
LRTGLLEAAGFVDLTAFTGFFTGAFLAGARTLAAGLLARVAGFFATSFFEVAAGRRSAGFAAADFLVATRGFATAFGAGLALTGDFPGFGLVVADGLVAFRGGAL